MGLRPEETKYIQDDRIGRGLARFYRSRHKDVFFRLALRAIKIFEARLLANPPRHHDRDFCWEVPGVERQELLTYGKNKDHRPDLKQLVLGLNRSQPTVRCRSRTRFTMGIRPTTAFIRQITKRCRSFCSEWISSMLQTASLLRRRIFGRFLHGMVCLSA